MRSYQGEVTHHPKLKRRYHFQRTDPPQRTRPQQRMTGRYCLDRMGRLKFWDDQSLRRSPSKRRQAFLARLAGSRKV